MPGRSPVLLLRERGPGARGQLRWLEVAGWGHALALNALRQWAAVKGALRAGAAALQ